MKKQYAVYPQQANGQYVSGNALKVFCAIREAMEDAEKRNSNLGATVYVAAEYKD